jgi:hypothetical protein
VQIASQPLAQVAIEHDGLMWKPAPGCMASFEEFLAARELFREINDDARWNPWDRDDRAVEFEQAMDVTDQWTRAEPNFRRLTAKQLDARLERSARKVRAEHAKADRRRGQDKHRYDADREANRLALLELHARLAVDGAEVDGLRSKTIYPGLDDASRTAKVHEGEAQIARCRAEIDRLSLLIGNLEDVVDHRGWLPHDRRELNLTIFSAHRSVEIRELRTVISELAALVKASTDKTERADHRTKLRNAEHRRDKLLAIPELTAEDMCSECSTPIARHGWTWPTTVGPCPAWPRTAAKRREFREMFDRLVRASQPPAPPPPPKPEPLAVIESGLSISDVIARLAELHATNPDAEVRRGNRNRWELWPGDDPSG